jgi:hypothetical protein
MSDLETYLNKYRNDRWRILRDMRTSCSK